MTTHSLSLIEQKKLQWSKEREEMTKFYGLWAPTTYQINRRKISDSYLSQLGLNKLHEVFELEDFCNGNRCLPPIQKSILNECNKLNDVKNSTECNTSGYVSETDTKEQLQEERKKKHWRSQSSLCSDYTGSISSQGYADDFTGRLKWGDRGVGIGHLWEPTTNTDARLPEINNRPGTPHWLQRSLLNKNYIRGQNVNTEPEILLQREQKRLKALELQEAIKQQLQEKDKKRKEDKVQQMEEDRKLEQRVKKQQEIEKSRVEEEQKKQREKEERENKKSKIMQEALATAEQQAKEAKIKIKGKVLNEIHTKINNKFNPTDEYLQSGMLKENDKKIDQNETINSLKTEGTNLMNEINTCDVHTSLTSENYFKEFKSTIPLVHNQWTQTNSYGLINKIRKKKPKINIERPKWGVNRPNTKYMKQSEKDPFYQRKIKHRSPQCQSELEPLESSRSFDSTDESKSVSSSSHENDFNMNMKLNLKKKFTRCYFTDTTDVAVVNNDSNKYQNNENMQFIKNEDYFVNQPKNQNDNLSLKVSSNTKKEVLQRLSTLLSNLKMKRNYWGKEMEKISSEVSNVSLTME